MLANRGVLIFQVPSSPGPASHLSHREPEAPPTSLGRCAGAVISPQARLRGLSLYILPTASAALGPPPPTRVCCTQHFPSPILNILATVLTLAGGDYIFHGEREGKQPSKGIISPLFPGILCSSSGTPSLIPLSDFRKGKQSQERNRIKGLE